MKPDVSAVRAAINAPARTGYREGIFTAAEQACIAYAIQVVEGIFHSSMRCENYAPEHGGGPCDRCTTLAKLREEQKP